MTIYNTNWQLYYT